VGLFSSLLLFAALLLLISASRRLLLFELSAASQLLFRSTRPGLGLYALFYLPGTILHELSHWLMAELLRVPTGEITLIPKLQAGEPTRLGSVMTARVGPLRGFLVGIAPLLVGLLTLFFLGNYLLISWGMVPWWQLALAIYILIVISNSMLISREDRRYLPPVTIFLLLLCYVLYYLGVRPSVIEFSSLIPLLKRLNFVLSLAVSLNLILLSAFFGVRYLLEKVTHQRVTTVRS